MSFKSNIKIAELPQMDFGTYARIMNTDATRALKVGQTKAVILSNYKFACGYIGTLILFGKLSGELAAFYKKAKKERAVEKDYAKAICYFEKDESGAVKMHVAIDGGKGKPDKIQKNGKQLFQKLGIKANVTREVPEVEGEEDLNEDEVDAMDAEADVENDSQTMRAVYHAYQVAYAKAAKHVFPLIQLKEKAQYVVAHLEVAKAAYKACSSFVDKYHELQQKPKLVAEYQESYQKAVQQQPQLRQVAAVVKNALQQKAQVHGDADNMAGVLKDVGQAVQELRGKLSKAFELLNKIKK